jgi:uncharacterized protein DUF6934
MHYPKYLEIIVSNEYHVYEFASIGSKGIFVKRIQFSATDNPHIFNLGFGDKMADGGIDDSVDSKNGDRDKILATIVASIYTFTSVYPGNYVLFFGSSESRTRLYRMAISNNFDFLNTDFHIFAIELLGQSLRAVPFEKNISCVGFLVKKR